MPSYWIVVPDFHIELIAFWTYLLFGGFPGIPDWIKVVINHLSLVNKDLIVSNIVFEELCKRVGFRKKVDVFNFLALGNSIIKKSNLPIARKSLFPKLLPWVYRYRPSICHGGHHHVKFETWKDNSGQPTIHRWSFLRSQENSPSDHH